MLDLTKIRKDLHKIPELAFQEYKTQKYILNILKQFPDIKITLFEFTGILAEYHNAKDKPYKLFRADMDALPILEKTNAEFLSTHKGMMHACGHDTHMTILLGLIEKIITKKPESNILFLFQPAEEAGGGANRILQTDILKNYHITEAYALHINGKFPVGTVSTKAGTFFAATEEIDINITGKSAHVAFYQNGKNALYKASSIYLKIKSAIKKASFKDKILCEFGKMTAGTVRNAIAGKASLYGTIRALNQEDMQKIKDIIKTVIEAEKEDFIIETIYQNPYKAVINDENLYTKFKNIVKNSGYTFIEANTEMTGEDFGYFSQLYPSLLYWLGGNSPYNLHSDKFLPDEKAIFAGVDIMYKLALD